MRIVFIRPFLCLSALRNHASARRVTTVSLRNFIAVLSSQVALEAPSLAGRSVHVKSSGWSRFQVAVLDSGKSGPHCWGPLVVTGSEPLLRRSQSEGTGRGHVDPVGATHRDLIGRGVGGAVPVVGSGPAGDQSRGSEGIPDQIPAGLQLADRRIA